MPLGTAAAIVTGSLIGGGLSLLGSDRAADAQTSANNAAIAEQRRQFDIIMGLTQPGRQVGNAALNTLASMFIPGFTGLAAPAGAGAQVPPGAGIVPGGPGRFGPMGGPGGRPRGAGGPATIDGATGEVLPTATANDLSQVFRNLPGVQFLVDEAVRGAGQSGAVRGDPFGGNVVRETGERVGSLAENQVINRLLQLAGFGPGATSTAAGAASASGANISNLLAASGLANAQGIAGGFMGANQAIQGGLNNWLLMDLLKGGNANAMVPGMEFAG